LPVSDGAAALVLVSGSYARANNLSVLAIIRGFDDAATVRGCLSLRAPRAEPSQWCACQKPEEFTTAPSLAVPKARSVIIVSYGTMVSYHGVTVTCCCVPQALSRAGIPIGEVDLFELNEAFAVVGLANTAILKLDPAKVNVNGGEFVHRTCVLQCAF